MSDVEKNDTVRLEKDEAELARMGYKQELRSVSLLNSES